MKSPIRWYQRWILKRCMNKCMVWNPSINDYSRCYWWIKITDSNMYNDQSGVIVCPQCGTYNTQVVRFCVVATTKKLNALQEGLKILKNIKQRSVVDTTV